MTSLLLYMSFLSNISRILSLCFQLVDGKKSGYTYLQKKPHLDTQVLVSFI